MAVSIKVFFPAGSNKDENRWNFQNSLQRCDLFTLLGCKLMKYVSAIQLFCHYLYTPTNSSCNSNRVYVAENEKIGWKLKWDFLRWHCILAHSWFSVSCRYIWYLKSHLVFRLELTGFGYVSCNMCEPSYFRRYILALWCSMDVDTLICSAIPSGSHLLLFTNYIVSCLAGKKEVRIISCICKLSDLWLQKLLWDH